MFSEHRLRKSLDPFDHAFSFPEDKEAIPAIAWAME
jgi:hypothetical protein